MFKENRDDILSREDMITTILDAAAKEIEKLDDLIANLPAHEKPSFNFTPPGMTGGQTLSNREKQVEFYKGEQERIKTETKSRISKLIENVSPDLKHKISIQIDKWQNPDLKEKLAKEKDILASMEVANDLISQYKGEQPKNPVTEKQNKIDASLPAWLTTPLNDRLSKNPDKEREKDRDSPELEPDKD